MVVPILYTLMIRERKGPEIDIDRELEDAVPEAVRQRAGSAHSVQLVPAGAVALVDSERNHEGPCTSSREQEHGP